VPIVIPKWRAHNVPNWKDLLVDKGDGQLDLNEATATLLNYMPVIGITTLTPENAGDAWCRIAIYQALFGSFIKNTETDQPYFLTKSDVFRHIGVETEGLEYSFPEFCSRLHLSAQQQEESNLPSYVANGRRSLLQVVGIREKMS